jgi:hypothetical protein
MTAYLRLDQRLKDLGIDTRQHGFFAQSAFLTQQAKDPAFVETYAEWVRLRPRTPEYDAYVRRVVPIVSEIIVAAFKADNCHGWCVAASGMMARMLDRLGVWNYGVLGSTGFAVPSHGILCGFYRQDFEDFSGVVLGHAWLAAPPYEVIDPTVALQNWGNDPVVAFLPPYVAADKVHVFQPEVLDTLSLRMRDHYAATEGQLDDDLHWRLEPHLRDFLQIVPATSVDYGPLQIRYVPSRINLSPEPLELMSTDGGSGRTGRQIWEADIMPAFGLELDAAS